ncbi:unnamed protein product, partial [Urochloa humidicola]
RRSRLAGHRSWKRDGAEEEGSSRLDPVLARRSSSRVHPFCFFVMSMSIACSSEQVSSLCCGQAHRHMHSVARYWVVKSVVICLMLLLWPESDLDLVLVEHELQPAGKSFSLLS